jgi:hypothetical protein
MPPPLRDVCSDAALMLLEGDGAAPAAGCTAPCSTALRPAVAGGTVPV